MPPYVKLAWDTSASGIGSFPSSIKAVALTKLATVKASLVRNISEADVPASVLKNAGIGKI